jgi:hypothetical protein
MIEGDGPTWVISRDALIQMKVGAGRPIDAAARSRLDATARLDAKVPMAPADVAARLREASDLLALCRRLSSR